MPVFPFLPSYPWGGIGYGRKPHISWGLHDFLTPALGDDFLTIFCWLRKFLRVMEIRELDDFRRFHCALSLGLSATKPYVRDALRRYSGCGHFLLGRAGMAIPGPIFHIWAVVSVT